MSRSCRNPRAHSKEGTGQNCCSVPSLQYSSDFHFRERFSDHKMDLIAVHEYLYIIRDLCEHGFL